MNNPLEVPEGLIHDWVGAAFVPERTVEQGVALLQDYANQIWGDEPNVARLAMCRGRVALRRRAIQIRESGEIPAWMFWGWPSTASSEI